jgi:hypothetical protein
MKKSKCGDEQVVPKELEPLAKAGETRPKHGISEPAYYPHYLMVLAES